MVMKRIMKERFVLPYYVREIHNKLQRLYQESKSVDDYYMEMEISLIRANIEETNEATMAILLNGLNRNIQDVVELQSCNNMDELIHSVMKLEQQLNRKQTYKKTSYTCSSWKDKDTSKKEDSSLQHLERKSSRGNHTSHTQPPPNKSSSIKCFKCLGKDHIASQCPNKRTMIVLENGGVNSDPSKSSHSSSSEAEDDGFLPPKEGDLLMIRRLMGSLCKDRNDTQRENIFHYRCLMNGKVFSLIIDGGSCTNVASTRLVEKLGLKTTPHPKPYKFQWLSDNGKLVVEKQVLLTFSIGKYVGDVLRDMVPMEARHVLLGRPWQYDRDVVHNGVTNQYSFLHKVKR